jgi:hypothetical protein
MRFAFQLFGLVLTTYLLTSCDNNSQENTTDTSNKTKAFNQRTADSLEQAKPTTSLHDYYFEPNVSTISGTLKVELYYGPPNFGELPETDAKEYSYILYPDKTINVIQTSDSTDFDVTTKGITKFQLAPMGQLSLHPYIDKRIIVTGQFYGKHTGHHHTDVLMTVSKAKKL